MLSFRQWLWCGRRSHDSCVGRRPTRTHCDHECYICTALALGVRSRPACTCDRELPIIWPTWLTYHSLQLRQHPGAEEEDLEVSLTLERRKIDRHYCRKAWGSRWEDGLWRRWSGDVAQLLEAGMSLELSSEWSVEKQGDRVSLQFVAHIVSQQNWASLAWPHPLPQRRARTCLTASCSTAL